MSLRSFLVLRAVALSVALGGAVVGYYELGWRHRLDGAFAGFAVWAFGCGANVWLRMAMYQELDR